MLKKSFLAVVAFALVFVTGQAMAGPNADAVFGWDIDASGNATNDSTRSATVADTSDIVVELFTTPVTGAVSGADILFDLDTTVVRVVGFAQANGFFTLGTTLNSAQVGAVPSGTLTNGYWGTVTFRPRADVTGTEFTIGLTRFVVAAAASAGGGTDTLTTAGVLSFNFQPTGPAVTPSAPLVTVPRGGQATATVTASGFPAGSTITFNVSSQGSATVSESQADSVLTLTVSGSGSATVTVTATDGTTTTEAVTVQFDEAVPVELASFAGEVMEQTVVLNWITASQTNNAGFRVLRSTDQENYTAVSEVIDGAGTTDQQIPYQFVDQNVPSAEQVFYVLEQIDLDGTIHRSNPIEVILGARFQDVPTEFASAVYPNPFNPSTTISYDLPVEGQVSIVIYDAIGQEVRQLVNEAHSAGRYSVPWDARDHLGRSVGSGVYIAKIKAGSFTATQKMLLLK